MTPFPTPNAEFNATKAAEKVEIAAEILSDHFGVDKREITVETKIWADGSYSVYAFKNYPMVLRRGKFTEECRYMHSTDTENSSSNDVEEYRLQVKYKRIKDDGSYGKQRTYHIATHQHTA